MTAQHTWHHAKRHAPLRKPLRHDDQALLTQAERASLASNPWFGSLSATLRHDLLCSATVQHFVRHEPIEVDTENGPSLDAVASGCLRLHSGAAAPHGPTLALVRSGSWYMDPAVFTGGSCVHSATALRDTTLLRVPEAALNTIAEGDPAFGMQLLKLQQRHAAHLFRMIHDVLHLSLRDRLAKTLTTLRQDFTGDTVDARVHVSEMVTQGQLAVMVGASRQRVNQELKAMERSGDLLQGFGLML